MGAVTSPSRAVLRHEALFYTGDAEYLASIRAFAADGAAAGEPVLVAVPTERFDLLGAALADLPGVRLVDMARAGRNPAWIIPGILHAFTAEHLPSPVRIVGEPIWPGRPADAYPRCVQHEALINLALAEQAATILCPYDLRGLPARAISDAVTTHPVLIRSGGRRDNPDYRRPGSVVDAFDLPLAEPAADASVIPCDVTGLSALRAAAGALGSTAGLAADRVDDLRVAVTEVATNAITHGGGPAHARLWADRDGVVCEVNGAGVLTDRLAGRIPPPASSPRGRGLLLVNSLCDLVHVHTTDGSTTVRLHMYR